MKRLSKKLHSECGASILMALLLLLVCMMVAASILGAAASNAGKYRSNRVEQQKYLTLSSALNLVIDEIKQAEYRGRYKVYEWKINYGTDDDPDWKEYFYVEQIEGEYSCGVKSSGDAFPGELTDQIPLGKELNRIFSTQFTGEGYKSLSGDVETPTVRTLTVSLPYDAADSTKNLVGYPYPADPANPKIYEIPKDVTVEVKLDHNTGNITLTASLGTDTMSAELVAKNVPNLNNYNPPSGSTGVSGGTLPDASSVTYTYNGDIRDAYGSPMTWELNWIRKGAA